MKNIIWPIYWRGALWVSIATLTSFLASTEGFNAEKIKALHWFEWQRVFLTALLAGLIALRTFQDKSMARYDRDTSTTK